MTALTVAISTSEVNPLHPDERKDYHAVKEYETKVRRKILDCKRCGKKTRCFRIQEWKFCPFCGAAVVVVPPCA
jgi:ribosomal protein S27AE